MNTSFNNKSNQFHHKKTVHQQLVIFLRQIMMAYPIIRKSIPELLNNTKNNVLSKEALAILSQYTNLYFTLDKKGNILFHSADKSVFSLDNKNVTLNISFRQNILPKLPLEFPYMQNAQIVVINDKNLNKIGTLPVRYIFSKSYLKQIKYDFRLSFKILDEFDAKHYFQFQNYELSYYTVYLNSIRYYKLKTKPIIIKYIACFIKMSLLHKTSVLFNNHIHYEMRKMVLYFAENKIKSQDIILEYDNMQINYVKDKPLLQLLKKNYMLKKVIDDYILYLTFLKADLISSLKLNKKECLLDPDGFRNNSPINKYHFKLRYLKISKYFRLICSVQSKIGNFDYNENRDLISDKRLDRKIFTKKIKTLLCQENL